MLEWLEMSGNYSTYKYQRRSWELWPRILDPGCECGRGLNPNRGQSTRQSRFRCAGLCPLHKETKWPKENCSLWMAIQKGPCCPIVSLMEPYQSNASAAYNEAQLVDMCYDGDHSENQPCEMIFYEEQRRLHSYWCIRRWNWLVYLYERACKIISMVSIAFLLPAQRAHPGADSTTVGKYSTLMKLDVSS